MQFKHRLSSRSSIKKLKSYDFNLTEEEIKEAMKRNFDNPLIIQKKMCGIYRLYNGGKNNLNLDFYHSFDGFYAEDISKQETINKRGN